VPSLMWLIAEESISLFLAMVDDFRLNIRYKSNIKLKSTVLVFY
jgi:hypothetical protein